MDTFQKTLENTVNTLQSKIDAALERIASDEQIIEDAKADLATFQSFLEAYITQKENNSEAAATFYTSGRTDSDTIDFLNSIGVELPEELKQTASEEETEKEPEKIAV